MVERINICLTKAEASSILDALWFLRGQYTQQNIEDIDNENAFDASLSYTVYEKIRDALPCGEGNIMDCNDLLSCITITPTTTTERIKEIERIIGGSTGGAGSVNARSAIGGENTSRTTPTDDCDLALHFGRISEFIDILNGNNVDFFEYFEANTNFLELLQVISSVTGLDEVSIDTLTGFLAYIQELPIEIYQAGYTDELKDEIRCDLFCLTKDSCELKIADFADYFGEKATIGIPESLEQFLTWLQDFAQYGILTPRETVFAIFNLQLSFIRFLDTQIQTIANNIMPRGASERLLLQLILTDTPDNDYTLLCDECPTEWCVQFDFALSPYSQYFSTDFNGQYQAGVGYVDTNSVAGNGQGNNGVDLKIMLPIGEYTSVVMRYNAPSIGQFDALSPLYFIRKSDASITYDSGALIVGTPAQTGFNTDENIGGTSMSFGILISLTSSGFDGGGSGTITTIRFAGTGVNPFVDIPECGA